MEGKSDHGGKDTFELFFQSFHPHQELNKKRGDLGWISRELS